MSIKYTLLMGGSNPYFKKAIDPLFENIQPIFVSENWEQTEKGMELHDALFVDKEIKANGLTVANLLLGSVIFVTGWSANKILDHFFKEKLQLASEDLVNSLMKKLNLKNNHIIEIRHIVWYEDIELAIVIKLRLKNNSKIGKNSIVQAHRNAVSWFEANGKNAPIHSYIIENGSCNIEPSLYMSLQEMDDAEGMENLKIKLKKIKAR